jgi:hypothetical protein
LCEFLGLGCYPGYLDDCASVVFRTPTYSRRRASWDVATIRDVERRMQRYPFFDGYAFEVADSLAAAPARDRNPHAGLAPASGRSLP